MGASPSTLPLPLSWTGATDYSNSFYAPQSEVRGIGDRGGGNLWNAIAPDPVLLLLPGNAVAPIPCPCFLRFTQAGLWNAIALDALLGDSTQLDATLLAALRLPSALEGEVPTTVRGLGNPWVAPCSNGGGDHGLAGCDTFQV